MKSKMVRRIPKNGAVPLRREDPSELGRMIGEGILARVAQLLSKRGLRSEAMHSVIDSVTRLQGGRAQAAARFARRVFFDYPEILKEWFTNPRFTDPTGMPAALPLGGGRRSFAALVRQVAPGSDPVEALTVLTRTQTVVRVGSHKVRARSRVFNTSNSNSLNAIRMFCVIDAMLTMVEKNVDLGERDRFNNGFYERAATNRAVDVACIAEFRRFLREQGDDFMQTVDDWLSSHSVHPRPGRRKGRTCRVGTGVYMFASE